MYVNAAIFTRMSGIRPYVGCILRKSLSSLRVVTFILFCILGGSHLCTNVLVTFTNFMLHYIFSGAAQRSSLCLLSTLTWTVNALIAFGIACNQKRCPTDPVMLFGISSIAPPDLGLYYDVSSPAFEHNT